jgi:hypothetical protein
MTTTSLRRKLFEFRQYQIATEHFGSFVQLTKEKIHMRTAHSPLVGYWQIEAGLLNSVCHIWEYESFEHRARVRAALGADAEWNAAYLNKCKPWWVAQKNSFMVSESSAADTASQAASPGLYAIDIGPVELDAAAAAPNKLFTWRVLSGDLPACSVLSLSRIRADDDVLRMLTVRHSHSRMIVSALPFSPLR